VGTLRLLAPDPFFYLLGFFYGERAISWMEQRTASVGSMMRRLEQLFGRFGHALVFIMPNNYVCLIAGGSGMPAAVFWTLNVSGTLARITMFRWFGVAFQDQIDGVLRFISDYRPWILAVTVGIVVFGAVRELRSGTSELQQLAELEEQLEEAEDEHRALIDEDRKRREDDK
jgi:membrane protein DedA with SNARE-associated domain